MFQIRSKNGKPIAEASTMSEAINKAEELRKQWVGNNFYVFELRQVYDTEMPELGHPIK